jgi:hypothetical protein
MRRRLLPVHPENGRKINGKDRSIPFTKKTESESEFEFGSRGREAGRCRVPTGASLVMAIDGGPLIFQP